MLKIPPPIWALVYVILAAIVSLLLGWPTGLRIIALGILLIIAGVALSVTAAGLFRREGTELNPASPSNQKLVTSGPFAFSRNPMYSGLILCALGIAFLVGAWPMFLVPVAIFATVNFVHIPFEEAKMRRQFGGAFDTYARKVRRWI
ncbi:MAG TPA: isoprenylcysteine carboxylmethyltransferase family protein [Methylovirgula sp.]|nr:isoprenylcysteine carboxylmethyltransferase family protein [Methylovirgula sp.]